MAELGTMRVKGGLAEMLKGGVIMDVTTAEQARIAEEAGAVAVMALERVPADIRAEGGVARMADPDKIREIQETVTIPVMAKARIGHFVEAQILESLEVDYIDESEVLTPADTANHIDKWKFTVPFVCGCTNLGEALRRLSEGAAMIRTKGEAGTGDIVNAVTHMRAVFGGIRRLGSLREDELYSEAKNLQAPVELVQWVAEHGRLPVVTFTAGGIATPADAALCMQLGADGVFVGSGIFKSSEPSTRAKAIVEATTHYRDADVLARVSQGLGDAISAVAAFVVFFGALLAWFGWLPDTNGGVFRGFRFWLLVLEFAAVIAAALALRPFKFPLLVLAVAGTAWFFVTDLLSGGGDWSATVTIAYGLILLGIAVNVDRGGSRIYGFWLHVVAGLTIGGGLLWFFHHGDFDWVLIGIAALVYIALGDRLLRSSWVVLAAWALLQMTTHFAERWAEVGFLAYFPFGLFFFPFLGFTTSTQNQQHMWAAPLAYAALGL